MVRSLGGERDPLSLPWNAHALKRLLAEGKETQTEMARRMAVSPSAVTRFKERHAEAIEAMRADIENEFAGIALAQKQNRLSTYEELLERARSGKDRHLEARILRQMAEEMGHLPSRVQLSGTVGVQTTYTVTGADGAPIDTGDLT